MTSLGPQLPSPSRRRRANDSNTKAGPSVISTKVPASLTSQQDNISDDDAPIIAGPSLPPDLAAKRAESLNTAQLLEDESNNIIGPALPPHLRNALSTRPLPQDDSDLDEYTPPLPPDLYAGKRGPSPPSTAGPSSAQNRIVGPSFPTGPPDSDEEEIGPLPRSADEYREEQDGVAEFLERERRQEQRANEAARPKRIEREAWMLAPPSSSELLGSLDPTRLRSKRTLGGGSAKLSAAEREGFELWTETPQQRLERLQAEVSGKRKRAGQVGGENTEEREERERKKKRDEEIESRVKEHNRTSGRMSSLVDIHASKPKGDKKDPKDDFIWDHERDMSLGGRLMDEGKRRDIIKDAKGLGGRFERGRTGGYL